VIKMTVREQYCSKGSICLLQCLGNASDRRGAINEYGGMTTCYKITIAGVSARRKILYFHYSTYLICTVIKIV